MFRKEKKVLIDKNNSNKKTLLDKNIRQLNNQLLDLGSIKNAFTIFFVFAMIAFLILDISLATLMHKSIVYKIEFWVFLACTPGYIFMGIVSVRDLNRFVKKTKTDYGIAFKEREAERKVQKFLKDNLTEDYHLFENIYTGYGDIDVIVVGRTGVFMIEVKSNSGLIATNTDGYLSVIDGDKPNKNYREQIKKELSQVKKYIDNNTVFSSWVYPILVFPFGSVMKELVLESEYDKLKLPVLNEKDLLEYIYSNNQTKLTSDQIKKISKALEEWQKD